ncbi:multicopper oxidase CueO [Commensalibacter oyaizuii]|uniref:Multicopper oxidase CueO n=1 Tax=Commensalibacter oyaizuii TaxID=3043873 RepID=A0ABT6Q283_9PROT|nr:multicopper oxidase CueO [Commensalibacter sp. TBRC 16381]MDI2091215.1 multicopper oxidase CueO [Commensalibacter sp. TBRC 16381]
MTIQRRDFIKLSSLFALTGTSLLWSKTTYAKERTPLPIPSLLLPDADGKINLTLQEGFTQWVPGINTKTWGINQSFLGPAIQLKTGQQVTVAIHNQLPEESTLHWHGLIIPGAADGGPQDLIPAKTTKTTQFTVTQPAATCWVHPHTHGKTGKQVMMGLAGLVLIQDEKSKQLPIPKTWGVDDIPIILQDKTFDQKGQITYKLDIMSAALGWFGNRIFTNGVEHPRHVTPRGWVRLRLLNGCNARTLNLTTSDGRPFYVIASDGGFLKEPVTCSHLPIWMGERFEILINTSDGKAFDLITEPVHQMGMSLPPFNHSVPLLTIQPSTTKNTQTLPDYLVDIPDISPISNIKTRLLHLTMDPKLDQMGMQAFQDQYGEQSASHMHTNHKMPMSYHNMQQHGSNASFDFHNANKINNQAYDINHPLFDIKQGRYEKWIISGEGDMMIHPFHIHGTQFRILSENNEKPAHHRTGWKDIVHVEGKRSEVLVRFDYLASKEKSYMAHCHLLEHEDTGMMCGFTVHA